MRKHWLMNGRMQLADPREAGCAWRSLEVGVGESKVWSLGLDVFAEMQIVFMTKGEQRTSDFFFLMNDGKVLEQKISCRTRNEWASE